MQAVREGRGVFDNLRKTLLYLLSPNPGEVLVVLGGVPGAGLLDLGVPGGAVVLPLLAAQELWINLVTGSGSIDLARTAAFSTLVLGQLFNTLACRSATASALTGGSGNPWLWASIALGAALQAAVVHLPLLNQAFGAVPMTAARSAGGVAMASGTLWGSELRELAGRHRTARRSA